MYKEDRELGQRACVGIPKGMWGEGVCLYSNWGGINVTVKEAGVGSLLVAVC